MKIQSYRVPYTIKRGDDGEPIITLLEDKKTPSTEENVPEAQGSEIPNIAKNISDDNGKQLEILKYSLMNRREDNRKPEDEIEGFIELKYLV